MHFFGVHVVFEKINVYTTQTYSKAPTDNTLKNTKKQVSPCLKRNVNVQDFKTNSSI